MKCSQYVNLAYTKILKIFTLSDLHMAVYFISIFISVSICLSLSQVNDSHKYGYSFLHCAPSIWEMLVIEAPGHSDYFVNVNCRRRKYRPLAYVLIEKDT